MFFLSSITGLQYKERGEDGKEHCDGQDQKDGWNQHLGFVLTSSSNQVLDDLVLDRFRKLRDLVCDGCATLYRDL